MIKKTTRTVKIVIATALATVLLAGCQTTAPRGDGKRRVLSADEVRRLFVGNTVESYNLNTTFTSFTYYHPNGQASQERLWVRRLGSWSIQDDGKICLAFGKRKMKCRHLVIEDGRYFKILPDEKGEAKKIVRYRYFVQGNALAKRQTYDR